MPSREKFRGRTMRANEWIRWGIIASVIWAIAAGNAGLHFAVSPATSAYRTCIGSPDANLDDCKHKLLHQDWPKYSGDRVSYAALAGLAPVLIAWLAYGLVAFVRRRQIRPGVSMSAAET
jgi:hypothetical protein